MNFLKKKKKSYSALATSETESKPIETSLIGTPYESFAALTDFDGAASPSRKRIEFSTRNPSGPLAPRDADLRWVVSITEIEPKELITQGSSKIVKRATWRRCDAVMKHIRYNKPEYFEAVKNEITVSQSLRPHPRVLSFYGYAKILNHVRLALFEFHDLGSLVEYTATHQLDSAFITKTAQSISCGLLHLHREGFLHRNLRLSSILISSNYGAILGDVSLAVRKPREQAYITETQQWVLNLMPVKHQAPESILFHEYSEASDIFAFGMLLWHLVLEQDPLAEWTEEQVHDHASEHLPYTLNLDHSALCTPALKSLIQACLMVSPAQRIKCEAIRESLEN